MFAFCFDVSAQNNTINNLQNFNLPPGYKLHPKKSIINFSYKIDNSPVNIFYTESDLLFLKKITEEELESQKDTMPEYYNYVKTGERFINNLSPRVRSIYTTSELWYIYAFDRQLSDRLVLVN